MKELFFIPFFVGLFVGSIHLNVKAKAEIKELKQQLEICQDENI